MNTRSRLILWLTTVLVFAPLTLSWSQEEFDEKPFAETHLVLQLSDQEEESVVLDVANNLIRYYGGPDIIDIEIVTFGPGVGNGINVVANVA